MTTETLTHDWEQKGACLNGPHAWKCTKCGEWTRSYDMPPPDAPFIDPDNGQRYSGNKTICKTKTK